MAHRSRELQNHPAGQASGQSPGAWVPWPIVEVATQLDLRPASHGRVFWAILLTWCRYGQSEARLTVHELADMTNLSKRTVQGGITNLIGQDLIARVGRYGRFRVTLPQSGSGAGCANMVALPGRDSPPQRSANMPALPTRNHACASPTVYMFSSFVEVCDGIFTQKQLALITDVVEESSELLGTDIGNLTMDDRLAAYLGLVAPVTYSDALEAVVGGQDKAMARDFTKAVLALRRDERIHGCDLLLSGCGTTTATESF